MKKLMTLAVVALVAASANAQYAPEQGKVSLEVKFNPFSNNYSTFGDGTYAIAGKYFISDKGALRLGLGINADNTNNKVDEDDRRGSYSSTTVIGTGSNDWNTTVGESKTSKSTFSLDLGYEHHFANNGRLDLYVGAGIGFESTSYKEEGESTTTSYADATKTTTVIASTYEYNGCTFPGTGSTTGAPAATGKSSFDLNIKAFTGANYYLYKGLYLGAELGLKYSNSTSSDYDWKGTSNTTSTTGSTVSSNNTSWTGEGKNKNVSDTFKFYVEPALRLGWTF